MHFALGDRTRACWMRSLLMVLATCGVICAPAQAQVRVAAAVSGLGYTVTGLAPGDGIAPSIAFDGSSSVELSGRLSALGDSSAGRLLDFGITVWGPTVINYQWPGMQTALAWDSKSLVAAGSVAPVANGSQYFTENALMPWLGFSLAPHTRVTFSVDAALDLTLDGGSETPAVGFGGTILEIADSTNEFAVGVKSTSDSISNWVGHDDLHSYNASNAMARPLIATWDNDSSDWEHAYLQLGTNAIGEAWAAPTSPVPEPPPGTMLGIGCGLIFAWTRRTKRSDDSKQSLLCRGTVAQLFCRCNHTVCIS